MSPLVLGAVAGWLLGSFPTAYVLVKRRHGLDVRVEGSANVGANNALRTSGSRRTGALVLLGDALKGVLAVGVGWGLAIYAGVAPFGPASAALLGAVAGHNYNLFLSVQAGRLVGGKGLATAAGGFALLLPAAVAAWVVGFAVGLAGFAAWKGVRSTIPGNVVGTVLAVPAGWWLYGPEAALVIAGLALLVLPKHVAQMWALVAGRPTFLATLALVLGLGLAGCASSQPTVPPVREDAADALAALETRLLTTPGTVHYHVTSEGAFAADLTGVLEMTGDYVGLVAEGDFGGAAMQLQLTVLDGEVEMVVGGEKTRVPRAPALREAVVLGLVRMGLLHNLARLSVADLPDRAEGGAAGWVETHSARWGPTEEVEGRQFHTLRFALRVAGTEAAEATLWIDPATGLPVRRNQTTDFPGGTMTVVERYSGWSE